MTTPKEARECWEQWLNAIAAGRMHVAKAFAITLLGVLVEGELEPDWSPAERRAFLNWCDHEGLMS